MPEIWEKEAHYISLYVCVVCDMSVWYANEFKFKLEI